MYDCATVLETDHPNAYRHYKARRDFIQMYLAALREIHPTISDDTVFIERKWFESLKLFWSHVCVLSDGELDSVEFDASRLDGVDVHTREFQYTLKRWIKRMHSDS